MFRICGRRGTYGLLLYDNQSYRVCASAQKIRRMKSKRKLKLGFRVIKIFSVRTGFSIFGYQNAKYQTVDFKSLRYQLEIT